MEKIIIELLLKFPKEYEKVQKEFIEQQHKGLLILMKDKELTVPQKCPFVKCKISGRLIKPKVEIIEQEAYIKEKYIVKFTHDKTMKRMDLETWEPATSKKYQFYKAFGVYRNQDDFKKQVQFINKIMKVMDIPQVIKPVSNILNDIYENHFTSLCKDDITKLEKSVISERNGGGYLYYEESGDLQGFKKYDINSAYCDVLKK